MILQECLANLGKPLLEEIEKYSQVKQFSAQDYVVKQGQTVRFLPIVIEGSIKVFSNEGTMNFLLYYISSGETCIFSFAHIFDQEPVNFSAITEVDSELLLLPITKVQKWYAEYPRFNDLLLKAYQKHYNDLLHTTKQIVCYNLEERLLGYLRQKAQIEKSDLLQISHLDIALDLGTSREVITRLMKKLNSNEEAIQLGRKIKIL
ncbi:MAG: Crp/Fnr family transcriptional regulator [Reichenbachiella sp.]|uniref:Crp/Fnr family transcriptional regulator n=1 Tax=Reichenbachiella sp. TaxID=2184521 RepID=UPI0032640820